MARPNKLTPQRLKKITQAIAAGNTRDTAAALAGISARTLYHWLEQGKKASSGQRLELYEAVKMAEAKAEADRVARIKKAGKEGNWHADAWYLERRYPEKWGRRDRVSADLQHSGEVTNTHEHQYRVEIEQKLEQDQESQELLAKLWEREQRLNQT